MALVLLQVSLGIAGSQSSGNIEPGFGAALSSVQRAELAGASKDDGNSLVTDLNRALILNLQALRLSASNESVNRSALLGQVDQILGNVQNRADAIRASASQGTFMQKTLTYVFAVIAAAVLTLVIAYASRLWRVYKVKRTLQMRITLR